MTAPASLENKSYSIYGDAAQLQASRTVNTESIPSGGAFSIQNTTVNQLNSWQKIIKRDNFYEVLNRIEAPKIINNNSDNTQIQFEFLLPGFVRMDKMFLTFLATVSTYNNKQQGIQGFEISSASQNEYALLDIIQQCYISIGTSVFRLTSEEVCDTIGIKVNMITNPKTAFQRYQARKLGLEVSQPANCSILEQPPGLRYYPLKCRNIDYNNEFLDLTARNIANLGSGNSTLTYEYSIPLGFLNSFFQKSETWLPKQTPIKIFLTLRNSVNITGGQITDLNLIVSNPRQFNMIYEYNSLTYQANDEFNKLWVHNPLLYNYMQLTFREFYCDGATQDFISNVCIQEAMPEELYFFIYNKSNQLQSFSLVDYRSNTSGTTAGTNLEFDIRPYGMAPYILKYIRVFRNGVLLQDYRNYNALPFVQPTPQNNEVYYYGYTPYEHFQVTNVIESTEMEAHNKVPTTMNNIYNVTPFRLVLDTNSRYNTNVQGIDKGSINLRVEYGVVNIQGTPFSSTYVVRFYYKNPAQFLMDDKFSIQEVRWPSISTGQMNVLQKTINVN